MQTNYQNTEYRFLWNFIAKGRGEIFWCGPSVVVYSTQIKTPQSEKEV